ncbi:uncharacterized protein BJX67DRAFT_370941 [Aspergillus lucknowensis]|uniref:DUF6891 domain-containing protein n=1 Tax=Aspergillus lucknowensis TaxID=176173 RepID=A0ABR4LY28_9EURO
MHDARESIAWRVKSAFYTPDEIVDIVSESIADDETENQITLSAAKRAVRSALALEWAAQLERQRSWPIDQPTVSEKLARAFGSLEQNHQILARMNLACCQRCGVDEISGDRDEDVTRGYVFFHEQDTEGVVDGGDLHLAFGSFTKSERKNIDVGSIIVRSLRRAGLSVEWPENAGTRILVRCGEWRRRFEEMEDFEDVQDFDFEGGGSEDDSESEV